MRSLTLIFPYFCNRDMLEEQQRVWSSYPIAFRRQLHVIVVDDCSPIAARPDPLVVDGLASARIYRLLEKKRWNWLSCRNLGAELAPTEWMLLTDIDHAVPTETIATLLTTPLDPLVAYRFKRLTATRVWPYALTDCVPYKSHNDTWLLTRTLFFDPRVGGYDERLSGCYGTSGEFRDRVLATAKAHVILAESVIRYPREVIADASTPPTVYTRKGDPENDRELERRKALRSRIPDWQPLRLTIPYEQVG